MIALVRPAAGRVALSTLLGAGAACAAVGLLATSAWLIARAAAAARSLGARRRDRGRPVLRALARPAALRRAAHRPRRRVPGARGRCASTVYRRLEPLAPAALPAFREGDLLARFVHDVDALQDLLLRVVPPFAIALVAGGATVALLWWLLPAAGAIVLVALLLAATVVPWLTARTPTGAGEARGELSAAAVETLDGAAELLVNGALPARLRALERLDAELDARRRRGGAHGGRRARARDAAHRARALGRGAGRDARGAARPGAADRRRARPARRSSSSSPAFRRRRRSWSACAAAPRACARCSTRRRRCASPRTR